MKSTTVVLLLVSLGTASTAGADGMLDPSFGNGGLVTTSFPGIPVNLDFVTALAVLPDGRAVAVGGSSDGDSTGIAVARYLTSGALDTSFGGGRMRVGCAGTGIGGGFGGQAALLQPDGRLVLVGDCPGGMFITVLRLNADGSLDASFGNGGQVLTPFANTHAAAGVLQPDGRIVAVAVGCTLAACALKAARYNPDGSLDSSFGTGGTLKLSLAQSFAAQDAAVQPDGKLLIGGRYGPAGAYDFGLIRLLPNGTLDPSFGVGGVVTSDFGDAEEGVSLIVLGDGRIVLGGRRASDLAVVRYLPSGSLDTTFGNGGLATANSGASDSLGQVILLPNGKLLIGGSANQDFLLARLLPDGALDTSFGSSGFLTTDFAGTSDYCNAVAVAGTDRILAAGSTGNPPLVDFGLARYIATVPVALQTFTVE